MFELIPVASNTFYIQSPAKIGVVRLGETDVYLIDSGNDKDAGRRVRKLLDEKGWSLRGILTTHSNADHIGGCRYLQSQYGCKIFANGAEGAFTQWPYLEPSLLYGGYPPKELRHKFLQADASTVVPLTDPDFPKEILPIPLPGHFLDMVGYRTPDDVVFLADSLSGKETLEKYRIGFLYDVAAYRETLETIKQMTAELFIPAHADAVKEIAPLAQYNLDTVEEIGKRILDMCVIPLSFEDLLARLFSFWGLTMNFEQYALVGSTVRSYLAWLKDTGKLDARFENNHLLWEKL